jgi:hypothetical protein
MNILSGVGQGGVKPLLSKYSFFFKICGVSKKPIFTNPTNIASGFPEIFFPAAFFRGLGCFTRACFQGNELLFCLFITFPEFFPPGTVPEVKEYLVPDYTPRYCGNSDKRVYFTTERPVVVRKDTSVLEVFPGRSRGTSTRPQNVPARRPPIFLFQLPGPAS